MSTPVEPDDKHKDNAEVAADALDAFRDGIKPSEEGRFQDIRIRMDTTDLGRAAWHGLAASQAHSNWKGVGFQKTCFEMIMYPELIKNEGIATVIEYGPFTGAAMCYMAEQVKMGLDDPDKSPKFIGIDLVLKYIHPKCWEHAERLGITFQEGNTAHAMELFAKLKETMPKPWLIVEDAHYNCQNVLEAFDAFSEPGDYMIVEDCNSDYLQAFIDTLPSAKERWEYEQENEVCRLKSEQVRNLCVKYKDEGRYLVDSKYQDMFGFNVHKGRNSILRRMK
uniref:Cephalosporin hydroxylase n=1 Tax=Entomoneis paludosa TaxID=265537 RepID=A0A7S2VA20_9STRA|eukprot:CAMPEP_0172460296 /NCGR_PEP_ID=MMETSP1065-20121228/36327_1 /TAXON_ID=265537 /ORGANISM="Amphiprora paludosa, Strain CCMP125" /LENGTH=278 /DNA_ID=CAMNT_0013215281 /DNA_START=14 /DNA_END=850 /DNA_ORIENTATION=+